MNRKELKTALDKEGIHHSYYSLNGLTGGPWDGAFILEKGMFKWSVYYFERGAKFDIHYFKTEDEACDYFFRWIKSDPSTRKYYEPQ